MTSVKPQFRQGPAVQADGAIIYLITCRRTCARVSSGIRLLRAEWDFRRGAVRVSSDPARRAHTQAACRRIKADISRLAWIIRSLDSEETEYTASDVGAEFRRHAREYTLRAYMQRLIQRFRALGRERAAETYAAALRSFTAFIGDEDVMLDCLSSHTMQAYQAWHMSRGNTLNTVSFYLRILRATYRRAVDEGAIEDRRPFRGVYTGVEKTAKRAIPLAAIRRIKELDLTACPRLDHARDMFLLSFMLRGMSLVDMAFLSKTDLAGGTLAYIRRKTGQRLTIAWTPEMQRILEKYPAAPEPYLLPIIRRATAHPRRAYLNAGYAINCALKEIATLAGLTAPLTMYVARHSWATAARDLGVPISVISEGMGHDCEATTRIYLASLSTAAIDQANALILQSL